MNESAVTIGHARYVRALARAAYMSCDWAALQWLAHQADLRGDTTRADAYRLATLWKEDDVGTNGGADDLDNLQTLCHSCNSKKGARTDGLVQG